MEMRKLGSEGPEISVVGFGAWEAGGETWGPNESDDAVVEAIHAALDAGMTWIDTAEVYGGGRSEQLVGRAVKDRPRDEFLVFTKVGSEGPGTGYRPDQIRQAVRASLGRLGLDHIDLYQIHWPESSMDLEAAWGAMADLQDEGLVRHIGVSNFDGALVQRCETLRHVDSVQNRCSLLHPGDRRALLPMLDEAGTGYLAYSPLGLGLLTGALSTDTAFHPQDFRGGGRDAPEDFRPGNLERILERVERLRPIAQRTGTTVATVALRWVIEQAGVTAAIAGSRRAGHVRSNAEAGLAHLDERTLREIEAAFA